MAKRAVQRYPLTNPKTPAKLIVSETKGGKHKMDFDLKYRNHEQRKQAREKYLLERLREVESALSPENLTCDGELPKYMWKKKMTVLQRERLALIEELGREPKFEEIWGQV